MNQRIGDAAQRAILEWVDYAPDAPVEAAPAETPAANPEEKK